ncbi:MAG TPA: S8 family serine peptidase, partial [Fimbriimonadaceae bacterium]|nr:S8 family serine peptidase [Fimbriimonadaceae bacterium]
IEWAHAMAPNAKIYLVEADSSSLTDLLACVDKASGLAKVTAVSLSWGVDEFASQSQYDSHFTRSNVVYFSAAGDVGGVQSWPPSSQYVIAVGGTSLQMLGNTFVTESAWSDGGGGPSAFNGRPAFQHSIYMIVGGRRGCPDISSDADPSTGCSVYDSTPYSGMSGWLVFGGTSLSTPTVAGMYVASGSPALSSYNELVRLYGAYGGAGFRDIASGSAGPFHAVAGWDFVTGLGAPTGTAGF